MFAGAVEQPFDTLQTRGLCRVWGTTRLDSLVDDLQSGSALFFVSRDELRNCLDCALLVQPDETRLFLEQVLQFYVRPAFFRGTRSPELLEKIETPLVHAALGRIHVYQRANRGLDDSPRFKLSFQFGVRAHFVRFADEIPFDSLMDCRTVAAHPDYRLQRR